MSSTKKRIIEIFLNLLQKKKITTKEIANKYHISQRTAQRDIKEVVDALEINNIDSGIKRNSSDYSYYLKQNFTLSNKNIYILLKVFLSSRALNKEETQTVVNETLYFLPQTDYRIVKKSILNEFIFLSTLKDNQNRIDKIWMLEEMIQAKYMIEFQYMNYELFEIPKVSSIKILPTTIFFDNFYFFLVGLDEQSNQYITYRVDWMNNINRIEKKMHIEYSERYEHGLKKPTIAYGYSGKKQCIQFEYYGFIDYVIDRFPSCKIIEKLEKKGEWGFSVYLLQIEVEYSWGIKYWILGDSGNIRIIKPKEIAEDIKSTLLKAYQRYQ